MKTTRIPKEKKKMKRNEKEKEKVGKVWHKSQVYYHMNLNVHPLWKSIIIFLVIRKGTVNNFPNISFLEP
jgi:hypothetical protein